jgi:mycoredoxin-dependent peroxiredoxin
MALSVGDTAPDFTLKDHTGTEHSLSSSVGEKPVVLVFFPFAFSGVCQGEFCELSENLESFNDAGVQLFGISCDRQFALKAWAEQQGFTFPLLSDGWPHGAVAQAYECFNADLGCATRRTVVIGTDGKIADIFDSGGLGEARQLDRYTAAVSAR